MVKLPFNGEKQSPQNLLDNIGQTTVSGTDLLLGKIFDGIGSKDIARTICTAGIVLPTTKEKVCRTLFLAEGQKKAANCLDFITAGVPGLKTAHRNRNH